MVTLEITNYIKSERAKQTADDQIKRQLLSVNWSVSDISEAFNNIDKGVPLPIPGNIPKPVVSGSGSMWDTFQHILMFISLYVFASSLALILHYFVDKYVPGVDTTGYGYLASTVGNSLLYGYLSALIVSFPLWAFFFLRIANQTIKTPQIRQLPSRKGLIYITLVGTFIIMMVNVISTVFSLLNGNVSINFLLHFVITVGISAVIFVYYLNEVKEDRRYV